jgi:hypothetical protein
VSACSEPPPAPEERPQGTFDRSASATEIARTFGLSVGPPLAPDAESIPIRIVTAADGAPVGDALVVVVPELEFLQIEDYGIDVSDAELAKKLQRIGRAYATDGEGRTRVAPLHARHAVYAWRGEQFARATVERFDRAEQLLALSPRDLVVEVVDRDGRAQAGVPVTFGPCSIQHELEGSWSGVTGANGKLKIPAIQLARGAHDTCGRHAGIKFAFPSRALVERQIDAVRMEPARLELPECGSLEIVLEDATGQPVRGKVRFGGSVDESNEFDGDRRATTDLPLRDFHGTIVDGRFVYERVETGLDFDFRYFEPERDRESFRFDQVHVVGPTKPGERTRVVVRAKPSDAIVIQARAIDASGEPLRKAQLEMHVGSNLYTEDAANITTDDDGGFAIRISKERLEEYSIPNERNLYVAERPADGSLSRIGSVALADAEPGTVLEAGSVTLRPTKLLARGRVVDDEGVAQNRDVELRHHDGTELRAARRNESGGFLYTEQHTDDGGRFEFVGLTEEDRFQLLLSREDRHAQKPDPVTIQAGADDVTLTTQSSSSVEISFVFDDVPQRFIDPFFNPWLLRVGYRHEPGGWEEPIVVDSTGHLLDPAFEPGNYDFDVRAWTPGHGNTTLADIEGVVIGRHQHLRDPRLASIDLRGRLVPHLVEIVDAHDRPLCGELRFPPLEPTNRYESIEFERGIRSFVTLPDEMPHASVCVPRFRPVDVDLSGAQTRVVLRRRGIPIRIELDPAFVAPPEWKGSRLFVRVPEMARSGKEPDAESELSGARRVALAPGAAARFEVAEPGDWPLQFLRIETDDAGITRGERHELAAAPASIHVVDAADGQRFVIAPDLSPPAEAKKAEGESDGAGR